MEAVVASGRDAKGRDGGRAEAMPREGMVGARSEQRAGGTRLWLAPHS